MPVPLGLSVLDDRVVVLVNPGASTEWRFSNGGESPVKIIACKASIRKGKDAQAASIRLVDYTADWWRKLTFGTKIKVIADGATVFFGTIATRRYVPEGSAVLVSIECVGRTAVLYSDVASAINVYQSKTTAFIANDLISTYYPQLTRANINVANGYTVPEFNVAVGDNIGDLLDQLTKMDGYVVDVDETDDVHYYYPPLVNQGTLTDDDVFGHPEELPIEDGVIPPRNVVRILGFGTGGYSTKTIQEQNDSGYVIDSATKRVAQSFIAETARLSGLDVRLDRTVDPNLPAALHVEVQTDAVTARADATSTQTSTPTVNTTTWYGLVLQLPSGAPSTGQITSVTIGLTVTSAGNCRLLVYAANGSNLPTGSPIYDSGAQAMAGGNNVFSPALAGLPPDARYCIILKIESGAATIGLANTSLPATYIGNVLTTNTGASYAYTAGTVPTWSVTTKTNLPTGTKVAWSDDVTITPNAVPYPVQFSTIQTWAAPKLALTLGTRYWLILSDASATGAKNWTPRYYGASDPYTKGVSLVSTDSGGTWAALGYDLAFHLYWSAGPVDVTKTNTRAKLTAGVDNATGTFPVDKTDDFGTLPKLCDITTSGAVETVNVTARSTTSGPGNLTVTRAQAGTTAAAHNSGEYVNGDSIRTYGPYPYTAQDDTIIDTTTAGAVAGVVLTNHATPASRLKLPLVTLRTDLTIRNLVTVQRRYFDFNSALEIVQLDHELTEAGRLFTTVQVGALDYDAARAIEQLRQEAKV